MIYVNFCVIFTMYRVNAFVASSKVIRLMCKFNKEDLINFTIPLWFGL